MVITVEINNCRECRHSDHTGAFTKGGAKPICGHRDYCYPEKPTDKDMCSCFNRILEDFPKIPDYCVLKHGSYY